MEHQAVKDNATKQRVRAFPSLVEHQAIKDNAVKQTVRAALQGSFEPPLPHGNLL
jgi:hypothetical protein